MTASGSRQWYTKDGRYKIHCHESCYGISIDQPIYIPWYWSYDRQAWRRVVEFSEGERSRNKAERLCEEHVQSNGNRVVLMDDGGSEQPVVETTPAQPVRSETMSTDNAAVAEATAPTKKARRTKTKTGSKVKASRKKASAKGTKGAKAPKKKGAKSGEDTIRLRVFKAINAAQKKSKMGGLTGKQIQEQLGLGGIPSLLKDEGVTSPPRIKRISIEGVRGVVYQLTVTGKKALEKGTVDSDAAPPAEGAPWPDEK